jgi:hypothetical protein
MTDPHSRRLARREQMIEEALDTGQVSTVRSRPLHLVNTAAMEVKSQVVTVRLGGDHAAGPRR